MKYFSWHITGATSGNARLQLDRRIDAHWRTNPGIFVRSFPYFVRALTFCCNVTLHNLKPQNDRINDKFVIKIYNKSGSRVYLRRNWMKSRSSSSTNRRRIRIREYRIERLLLFGWVHNFWLVFDSWFAIAIPWKVNNRSALVTRNERERVLIE